MKKLFTLIGVAALLATVSAPLSAQAQPTPAYTPISITLPPVLAAGTTNLASPPVLFTGKSRNILFSSTSSTDANGATNVYSFARSVDSVYYDTNSADIFKYTNAIVAGAGTNTAVVNWDVQGGGYLKCFSIVTTATTGSVTNQAASYSQKIGAP